MKIHIRRLDDHFLMEATNESGHHLHIDAAADIGGGDSAFRPMQLLLTSLGGCSAIDVLMILKKQRQHLTSFEVDLEGNREKQGAASLFRDIWLHFRLTGDLNPTKVEKAVQLSLDKYCSVAKTLEPTARIHYKITINGHTLVR